MQSLHSQASAALQARQSPKLRPQLPPESHMSFGPSKHFRLSTKILVEGEQSSSSAQDRPHSMGKVSQTSERTSLIEKSSGDRTNSPINTANNTPSRGHIRGQGLPPVGPSKLAPKRLQTNHKACAGRERGVVASLETEDLDSPADVMRYIPSDND